MSVYAKLESDTRAYIGAAMTLKRQCIPAAAVAQYGFRYLSPEELVVVCGSAFPADLGECDYPPMRAGNCFANSFTLALRDHSLRYYEGYAMMAGSMPVHHGWVVDANDKVQDPTWAGIMAGKSRPAIYIGVHIPLAQHIGWLLEEGNVSLLTHGEMVAPGLLERGLDLFTDYDLGEVGVCPEMVKAALRVLEEHGGWELDETTGIFTHSGNGLRWNGRTQKFI